MKGMSENVFLNIKNRSLTITADVEIPKGGANGVIIAQGGRFGGWSLYFKEGKPAYAYNFLGLQRYTVAAAQAVPAGKATIRFEFAYDGGGLAKGGLGAIYVGSKKIAEGRIERTQPMIFSADETADVGEDDATPVTEDYKAYDNKFTGGILKVTVDVKPMGAGEKVAASKTYAETAAKVAAAE
jgi:arylsulfatase